MEEPRTEHFSESQGSTPKLSKGAVIKNLFIVSLGTFSVFTGFDAAFLMQSTMNADRGIGVASQAIVTATAGLSALLLPKYVIQRFGYKVVMPCSAFGFGLFTVANFYPRWGTMVPAAMISGLSAALFCTSNHAYVTGLVAIYSAYIDSRKGNLLIDDRKDGALQTRCIANTQEIGRHYDTFGSENSNGVVFNQTPKLPVKASPDTSQKDRVKAYTKDTFEYVAAMFFGFYIVMYSLSHVVSSLLSYFILDMDSETYDVTANSTCVCGSGFGDSESDCLKYNVLPPPEQLRYLLNGVGVALVLVSVALVFFLDPLEAKKAPSKFTLDALFASARLFKNKKLLLLVPLTFFMGVADGFFKADFTKAYVSCSWGTNHVGLVSVFYGVAQVLSSFVSGSLVKHLGRIPIFLTNIAITLGFIVFVLMWKIEWPHQYLYIGSTAFGLFSGVYASQVRALYGVLFKDNKEAAFGNYQLVYALGNSISFAYSAYLYTYVKIYILLAVFILGMLGYIILDGFVLKAEKPTRAI